MPDEATDADIQLFQGFCKDKGMNNVKEAYSNGRTLHEAASAAFVVILDSIL